MLKYAIYLSIVLAVALPHQNTLTERLGVATFGLIDAGTVREIGSQVRTTFSSAASVLHKSERLGRRS